MRRNCVLVVAAAVVTFFCSLSLRAENFNSINATNNIISQTGNVISVTGYVKAQTFFTTPGSVSVGTTVSAGGEISGNSIRGSSSVYSPGYVQGDTRIYSPGYVETPTAIFTNILRTGGSLAPANLSVALGAAATASSFSSVAIGRNNLTTALDGTAVSTTAWVDKDPLFSVGNGSGTVGDPNRYRNAFTVYKDGTVTLSKPQGDIQMGQFN